MLNEALPFGMESKAYLTGSDISKKCKLFVIALLDDVDVLPGR